MILATISPVHCHQFVVDPGAFSFNLTVPMEILIGTVPLQESFSTFPQANDFQPSAPVTDFGPSPVPGYPPVGGGGFVPPFRLAEYPDLRKIFPLYFIFLLTKIGRHSLTLCYTTNCCSPFFGNFGNDLIYNLQN